MHPGHADDSPDICLFVVQQSKLLNKKGPRAATAASWLSATEDDANRAMAALLLVCLLPMLVLMSEIEYVHSLIRIRTPAIFFMVTATQLLH